MADRPTCQCKTPVPMGALFCWSHGGRHAVAVIHAEDGHVRWRTLESCVGRAERLLAVTRDGVQMLVLKAEAVPAGRPQRLELHVRAAAQPGAKPDSVSVPLLEVFDAIQSESELLAVAPS